VTTGARILKNTSVTLAVALCLVACLPAAPPPSPTVLLPTTAPTTQPTGQSTIQPTSYPTTPPTNPPPSFTFAVYGDTRTQHDVHRQVVERILVAAPDFALHTGDLVADGSDPGQWDTFFEIERDLLARTPLFPTLGNHEGNSPLYFERFDLPGNGRWYTFDYGNARFVCLEIDGFADFSPGSEQYAWLEETLAANTQPWLFVFFHEPPYTSAEKAGYESSLRQTVVPLFEQYGVDVVFSGHKHDYERNEVNGITYVVTGGGGAPLYPMQEREPTQAAFAMEYHFVLVRIEGDHLEATVISLDGEVLDTFERDAGQSGSD
jgi:predicted phosphodiesterase